MDERSLFLAALDKPDAAERAAFLDANCPDPELRRRVEELLQAHADAGSFLKPRADQTGAYTPSSDPSAIIEGVGTVIGPYRLLQPLGEGGMGAVFMAEQQRPVRRMVALKVIKPGLDSRQVVARFEAERQALALMDHPNIAKVLDAGTTEHGRLFFVMELVKGIPITKYCDQQHLTPRERLELFIPVCQAIQHAHQKGVIHRDLKPSNVMVALYDGRPVPKVIDFGVAKALHQKLTERTMFTEFGQVVGTLEYMSPEQAELNQLDIDTRSDVYALGVLLYELLTGSTPFDRKRLGKAAFDEMLRIIREEEPPKPSTRLSGSDELPTIAANRRTEPKTLGRLVRGELDWIVMRCLEKERARRYETANGVAGDLLHYLADEPVLAGPPSAGYRLRKYAREYKAALTVAATFVTLLATATGISTWLAWRAAVAEGNALEAKSLAIAKSAETMDVNGKLRRSQDELELTLARSLVRPFREEGGNLSEPEAEALWDLAQHASDRLWFRFLDEATWRPLATAQLSRRAEFAWVATIGLDTARRARAEQLLTERLHDSGLNPQHKLNLAVIALALVPPGSTTSQRCTDILTQIPTITPDKDLQYRQIVRLMERSDRLVPGPVARMLVEVLEAKEFAPTGYFNNSRYKFLAKELVKVTGRLEAAEAARLCAPVARALAEALNKESAHNHNEIARILAVVAERLKPEEAEPLFRRAAQTLAEALSKVTDAYGQSSLAESLTPVAERLKPLEAAQMLADAFAKTTGAFGQRKLADGLAAVTRQMDSAEAAQFCGPAVQALTEALTKATDGSQRKELAEGLMAVAGRLRPAEAGKAARQVIEAAEQADGFLFNLWIGIDKAVASAVGLMEPAEAIPVLAAALAKAKTYQAQEAMAKNLATVAQRLRPSEAVLVCAPAAHMLAAALEKETDVSRCGAWAEGLAALAGWLGPPEATRLCRPVAQKMADALTKETTKTPDRKALAELEAKADAAVGRVSGRRALANGLAAVAGRLGPVEAAQLCQPVVRALAEALKNETDTSFRTSLDFDRTSYIHDLAVLARLLEPTEAARLCAPVARKLAAALAKEERPSVRDVSAEDVRWPLAESLKEVSDRLEPVEAARLSAIATRSLGEVMVAMIPAFDPFLWTLHETFQNWPAQGLAYRLNDLDTGVAREIVRDLAQQICSAITIGDTQADDIVVAWRRDSIYAELLNILLLKTPTPTDPHQGAAAAVVKPTGYGPGVTLPLHRAPAEPLACWLDTQDLVNLLKVPTCYGEVRKVILKHIGNRYGRQFADHWEFVEYAQAHNFKLDFTTPPVRYRAP